MTEPRWRRLPFTSTSVASEDSPRRLAGRTTVASSLIGWVSTLYDGTVAASSESMSVSPKLRRFSAVMTSTGTGESAAERS